MSNNDNITSFCDSDILYCKIENMNSKCIVKHFGSDLFDDLILKCLLIYWVFNQTIFSQKPIFYFLLFLAFSNFI